MVPVRTIALALLVAGAALPADAAPRQGPGSAPGAGPGAGPGVGPGTGPAYAPGGPFVAGRQRAGRGRFGPGAYGYGGYGYGAYGGGYAAGGYGSGLLPYGSGLLPGAAYGYGYGRGYGYGGGQGYPGGSAEPSAPPAPAQPTYTGILPSPVGRPVVYVIDDGRGDAGRAPRGRAPGRSRILDRGPGGDWLDAAAIPADTAGGSAGAARVIDVRVPRRGGW